MRKRNEKESDPKDATLLSNQYEYKRYISDDLGNRRCTNSTMVHMGIRVRNHSCNFRSNRLVNAVGKDIPEIPVDAAREAVINAFAHRQIESGQSVEVAIYRSFIEIYSPGRFPDGVTPEMFIKEVRKPIRRNPLITRTLYYSKDMESFATGLKRIQDACDEAGCKVEYYGDEYGFTVRFYRHCGEGWGVDMSANGIASTDPKVQDEPLDEPLEIFLLTFTLNLLY